ncbi:hypothetical protein [Paraburkholderia youngii]|uniref:Anti-sigma regulatory factor n=1 Tax=Paraburkholderia youngii TaxID=2782701 RepID=A0A7Y6MYU2_9BURK|nr:hypothetical protein [Paraburkholderia youngii]NUY01172.1 anti-sigma regulatory factor [Paraburkholderia youngii]
MIDESAAMARVLDAEAVSPASELARDTLTYGRGGDVYSCTVQRKGRTGPRLAFIEQGPGIADLQEALTDGFTSRNGLGVGLGGARAFSYGHAFS